MAPIPPSVISAWRRGATPNPHYHHDEQFLYLFEGAACESPWKGEILEAAPGDLVQFRPGEVHEIMALDEPVELLLTRSPARPSLEVLAVTPEGEKARSVLPPRLARRGCAHVSPRNCPHLPLLREARSWQNPPAPRPLLRQNPGKICQQFIEKPRQFIDIYRIL